MPVNPKPVKECENCEMRVRQARDFLVCRKKNKQNPREPEEHLKISNGCVECPEGIK